MDFYDDVPEFSLTITQGGDAGQRFVFNQPEVTLGRIADNDLVLYDPAVSRRHVVIYYRNGQFIVEDLGSSNGSLLNGYPLAHPTVLCDSDTLTVGAVQFHFSSVIEETYDPTEIEVTAGPDAGRHYENPNPVVRRWDGSGNMPLPPEGETRTFPAQMAQGPAFAGPQRGQMQPPGMQGQHPQAPYPSGMYPPAGAPMPTGIRPPTHPPQYPTGAPHPSSIPPAASGQFAPPRPAPAIARPKPSPPKASPKKNRKQLRAERRKMQYISLWSFFAFVIAGVLLLVPHKKTTKPTGNKDEPIVYSRDTAPTIKKTIYGNGKSKKDLSPRPFGVTFRFYHQIGRVYLTYNIFSQSDAVQVLLNGTSVARLDPTQKWLYQRHRLPRELLKSKQPNFISFRRLSKDAKKVWGLANVSLEEQPFPPLDKQRAKELCREGERQLKQKKKSPGKLYDALKKFLSCQDYAARDPSLFSYKQAELKISQIETTLNLRFANVLRQAKLQSGNKASLKRLYSAALAYFTDPKDHRYQYLIRELATLRRF